ncbi:tyrosine-type recombinase/integrase [Caenimonas koreensis DSM 17982]|uniref:Tyrosine-type recombinase/integrase n=1 Tax=Caenimonas koreensis DSM 17982 TaxID=1121255 RepID=A0A844ATU9_9BURK|nr:integrase domain-containing protein [Caenimonas koreensis]MRD47534.1 tyrosine-type recombinase/integrase [Caenimonas koreensis DSM 17982]
MDSHRKGRVARGGGSFKDIAQRAVANSPGDPHRQLNVILRKSHIPAAFGEDRPVSDKTRSDYGRELHRAITLCRTCCVPIQNITDLNRKHVIAFCRQWEKEGLCEKTVAKYVSTLRRFLELLGKRGAIPVGQEWRQVLRSRDIVLGTQGTSLIAKFPKGWRDHGVDPNAVIDAVEQVDELVACQFRMQLHFGLRVNESCQIVPRDSDKGDHLMVWRGTKGGKERRVEFSSDPQKRAAQRQTLNHAMGLASRNSKGCLGNPKGSLRAMKNRMTYLARKHGIRRTGLGITLHGLRHQFACDLFRELTGLPAPVLREVEPSVYGEKAELVRWAILEIARQLGHERGPISYAYIGSPSSH